MPRNRTLTVAQQQLYTAITRDILLERCRQIQKFGAQAATPLVPEEDPITGYRWYTQRPIKSEEACKRACDMAFEAGRGSWAHIMAEELAESIDAKSPAEMRIELIQLAACCFGAIEALDFQRNVRAQDEIEGTSSGPGEIT